MKLSELKSVEWRTEGAVGVLTLNRPERLNAIDSPTIDELAWAMIEATHNPAVRALVVTGNGRGFSAGADVQSWSSGEENSDPEGWTTKMHNVMNRLYRMPKPAIAAVNGVAVGAGCDLTLACDLRIASTAARFGEAYVRVGFCPDAGGSYLLPRVVGEARAAEMIYTGRIIDAEEADRIGLVSEVVAPEQLLPRTMELAADLAAGPTVAIGLAKQNIRAGYTLSFEQALAAELRAGELCGKTEDHAEGLQAAVDKRTPNFVGR